MEIHQLGAIPNMAYDPLKESENVSEAPEKVAVEKESEYQKILKDAKNKRLLMIGGAVAAAGILFYLWKKSKK